MTFTTLLKCAVCGLVYDLLTPGRPACRSEDGPTGPKGMTREERRYLRCVLEAPPGTGGKGVTFTTLGLQRRHREQIAWLRTQPEFPQLLGEDQDMTDAGRALLQVVAERMTLAGVTGVEQHRKDRRVSRIRALVTEARR